VNHAPQLELLKRSALYITHAGLNTVLESLTQGVPMVAIPITNDQPGVAARVAHTKSGTYVSIQEMTSPRVSTLVDEVLSSSEYREKAGNMKQAIVESNGLERGAELLEQAFNLPSLPPS
jgi:zeaxanthin glucosyltransferase